MITHQQSQKALKSEGLLIEIKQSQQNLKKGKMQSQHGGNQSQSRIRDIGLQPNRNDQNSSSQYNMIAQIEKLIGLYSKKEGEKQELTYEEFKQLARDLYATVDEKRQLKEQELNNLISLFQNTNEPKKKAITKDMLKKKANENRGNLGLSNKKS